MDKTCAYCDQTGSFTREHIWPKWLIDRTNYPHSYSARANKVFDSALVIRDVCAKCNNGPLSELDGYVRQLYDSHFTNWVAKSQEVDFKYDHGRLLRWLLKITYNSARTTGNHVAALTPYRKIIIADGECTPLFAFARVTTIMPFQGLDPGAVTFRAIQPDGARCGPIIIPGYEKDTRFIARMVTIKAYFFSILIIDDELMDPEESLTSFSKLYGTALIPTGRIVIPPPTINTLTAMRGVESWPWPKLPDAPST